MELFKNLFKSSSQEKQQIFQQLPPEITNVKNEISEECSFEIITKITYKNNKYYINDNLVNNIRVFCNNVAIDDLSKVNFINKCPLSNFILLAIKGNVYEFFLKVSENEKYNIFFYLEQQSPKVGGGKKYNITKEKVNIINNKKKITRTIYTDNKKTKFVKINNEYKNLNKCKIVK